MATLRSLNMFSDVGPCGVRCSTPGCTAIHPPTMAPTTTANPTLDSHARRFSMASSIADGRLGAGTSWSNERAFQHDAAVDGARSLRQQPDRHHGHLRAVGQLAQQVDQPAHGADEIALVAAERAVHDAGPIVVARGPAIDGRHESRLDADRHAEVPAPLGLKHRVGDADERVDLALELAVP